MTAFCPTRLTLARQRRGWTLVDLAGRSNLSTRRLSDFEAGGASPSEETQMRLSFALGFPVSFFYAGEVELFPTPRRGEDPYTASPASFRAHYRIPARDRERVLAAGLIAVMVAEHLAERFTLPPTDLPCFDLDQDVRLTPEGVAAAVRDLWGLGQGPIANMVYLLESKGVRVFRLVEELKEVDAFAFWRGGTPYVVLNTTKSGERSRFDAAHELGHLLLHRGHDLCGRQAEDEANRFAAAFLLPERPFRQMAPTAPILEVLLGLKSSWRVSVAAMVKRGSDLQLYSEWQARQAWIELSRRGWRTQEPDPVPHEYSRLFAKIQELLDRRGKAFPDIAEELHLPWSDVQAVLPLTIGGADGRRQEAEGSTAAAQPVQERTRGHLRLIVGGT